MTALVPLGIAVGVIAAAIGSRHRPAGLRFCATAIVPVLAVERFGHGGWALVACAAAAGGAWLVREERRRLARPQLQLPDFIDEVARALDTGLGLSDALVAGARSPATESWAQPVGDIGAQLRAGGTEVRALAEWRDESNPDLSLFAGALSLGLEAGGARTSAVRSVANSVRRNRHRSAELRAQSAYARASAGLLIAAPLVVVGLQIVLFGPSGLPLFSLPAGRVMLGLGVGLNTIGAVWMAALIRW